MAERRVDDEMRARVDEIERGYMARAAVNERAIRTWGRRTTRLLVALIVVMVGLGVWSLLLSEGQSGTLAKVQRSRREATAVTCAVLSAVTDAGRQVIEGSALPEDTPFMRFLESHGYPPRPVRQAQAREQAERYAVEISERVASAVGRKRAAKIVAANGSIDCSAFAKLVAVHRAD